MDKLYMQPVPNKISIIAENGAHSFYLLITFWTIFGNHYFEGYICLW